MTSTIRLALPLALLLLTLPVGRADASDSPSETGSVAHAVRARLAQPDAADTIHIDQVTVVDGVAVLTGTARTRFAWAEAVRVAKEVPGVREVNARRVRVEPNP